MQASSQVILPRQNNYIQPILPQQQLVQAQQVEASQQNAMVIFTLNGIKKESNA